MKPFVHPNGFIREGMLLCVWAFISLCLTGYGWAAQTEQLIVFTQPVESSVNKHFSEKVLPEIRTMCRQMHLPLSEVTVTKGVPREVGITPLMIYQNHLGRSVYQGRTSTLDRVKHFIRTSRRIPQGQDALILTRTPVWHTGHAAVWSPIKISDLGGTQPQGYDPHEFQKEAFQAILSGFSSYALEEQASMKRSDRGFYMDFYPWCAKDGTLYISTALYSQFHCKKPVFVTGDHKIIGPYKKRKALFMKAAKLMEEQVKQVIQDPLGGDGFDPVPSQIPVVSWESLGFHLPPAPDEKTALASSEITLSPAWHMAEKNDDGTPLIQFRFPPPLDQYSGEFTRVTGTLVFPEDLSFSTMKGNVHAHADSITMGEPDLDGTLTSNLFLNQAQYPTSFFQLETNQSTDKTLEFGTLSLVNISGTFNLKGKSVPLSLPVEIEPVLNDKEKPVLLIRGSFSIDLRTYGIEGATGPEPQKYTVLIDLNLAMEPDS